MGLFGTFLDEGQSLVERLDPKYAPAWEGRSPAERSAMAMYFLPHRPRKETLSPTRPRVIKWYCPFADQRHFPTGHRYCINVYTGCAHNCVYCYAAGYAKMEPKPKTDFRKLLLKDLRDLDAYDVPPAPVHISNSTDAFQPIEETQKDSLYTLRKLADWRHRFSTVQLITKAPHVLARTEYLDALTALDEPAARRRVIVHVTLAFWREGVSSEYEPGASSVARRVEAIRALRSAGLMVVIRVSPTYPIGLATPGGECPQTREDIDAITQFAADVGARGIIHTPAKIVRPKTGKLDPRMSDMLALYRKLAGPALISKGGAWTLPREIAQRVTVDPLQSICDAYGVELAFCMNNLLVTR
jgi:DNA repair photolyase